MFCGNTTELVADPTTQCQGLNPNPDLAGVGVRVAFYIQSAMNALLVVFSPRDSVPSAWAGTVLTGGLVIAAIVSKAKQKLTLHHATLVMNFATLSCISSLAVAPLLPIWRLKPNEYYARELERHLLDLDDDRNFLIESTADFNRHKKKKVTAAQNRKRVVLALALLTQVVLQWAWGIILFISPVYDQPQCSGQTTLILFFAPFCTQEINKAGKIAVWPMWILFSLGITLVLTIVLSLSSPNRAHDSNFLISRQTMSSTHSSVYTPPTPFFTQLTRLHINITPIWKDKARLYIFLGNAASFCLWLLYIYSTETQRKRNSYYRSSDNDGNEENNVSGFGQPAWSLVVALYKYPSLRRRQMRRLGSRSRDQSPSRTSVHEEQELLAGTTPTHSPSASRDLSALQAAAQEQIEMTITARPDRGRDERALAASSGLARADASPSRDDRAVPHRDFSGLQGVNIPSSAIDFPEMEWSAHMRRRDVV